MFWSEYRRDAANSVLVMVHNSWFKLRLKKGNKWISSIICFQLGMLSLIISDLDLYVLFQSQQARLVTLYLPLFGLLLENVYRLNVKDSTPLSNHNVSLTPTGGSLHYRPISSF